RVHADRVVMFLDACHSGAVSAGGKGLVRDHNLNAAAVAQGTGQMVICSSAPDQTSYEDAHKGPNSVFTKHLIKALQMHGQNTKLGEAFDAMKDEVQEEVLRDRAVLQTPVMKPTRKGMDFV